MDSQRNVYVTGQTRSPNFPLRNQVAGPGGDSDVFVAKLDPTLSTLIYSTYLGGQGADRGNSIAVDAQGNAYVTGSTQSSNFPVTSGGTDGACNGGRSDVFIIKLTSGGQLAYSTFVGDSEGEVGTGIAVDALGSAYVTGSTLSRHFPTTPGVFRPQCEGGDPVSRSCTQDAFVLRINATASDLIYSTFLGGTNVDMASSIAIDVNSGLASAAYITGTTHSADFPTTPGAFQPHVEGRRRVGRLRRVRHEARRTRPHAPLFVFPWRQRRGRRQSHRGGCQRRRLRDRSYLVGGFSDDRGCAGHNMRQRWRLQL